jgi:zinc and cadmium transporter
MTAVVGSLVSVVLVSLISLVGLVTLSLSAARIRELATLFVSFAVGALLGDAFIHILPEAFEDRSAGTLTPSLMILAGMLVFFIAEKLLRHRHGVLHAHHHGEEQPSKPALAAINIFGDVIHNIIDGILIGASYLAEPMLGVTTTIAVALHEIPQELGDFGVLVHSGMSPRRAVLYNLAASGGAVLGTIVVLLVGRVAGDSIARVLLPMTAGGFVYIAAADLIPELQHERNLRITILQTLLICSGAAVMGLLTLLD